MAIRFSVPSGALAALLIFAGCGNPSMTTNDPPGDDEPDCEETGADDCPGPGGDPTGKNPLYYVPLGERTAEVKRKPWSSWWYPLWQDTLFEGKNNELSTLEKYDAFASAALRKRVTSAAYERATLYDPRAASWSGLCDAWAIASILEPEPAKPMEHDQLTFRVGDLKALVLKTYEKLPSLTIVGARFNGEWNDEYADIAPHKLHQVIESELIKKGQAFIIDEDPGPEVWNEPAWKVVTRIEKTPDNPKIARVRTWLFLASPHVEDRDFVGTQEDSREYTYDLEGVWEGDQFGVVSGQWTDRSQWDHPDYAIILPEKIQRGSFNPHIDPAMVDRIRGR